MSDEPEPSPLPAFHEAFRSPLDYGKPNEEITLFEGSIEFNQKGKSFQAFGRVFLKWLPSLAIRFEASNLPEDINPTLEDLAFRLEEDTNINHCIVTGTSMRIGPQDYRADIAGIVNDRVIYPKACLAHRVIFLVPNFLALWARREDESKYTPVLKLNAGSWHITLNPTKDQEETLKFLKSYSGFGITHLGRLEKTDGSTFTVDEAFEMLKAFGAYASFAVGRWVGPCLSTGLVGKGNKVWQCWDYSRTVAYRYRNTWLDELQGEQFEIPFAGFMKLWLDEDWQEVISNAIHWHVEANAQAGSIEGSIVLTQTAFELLAFAVLVEKLQWLTAEGYENLKAAGRIRLLFRWAGIPTEIPTELMHLTKLAKEFNWVDTFVAMIECRNLITHPVKKNRDKLGKQSDEARLEVWKLGLWCLELCLLRLFEYRGSYRNRITGNVEVVPWATEAGTP